MAGKFSLSNTKSTLEKPAEKAMLFVTEPDSGSGRRGRAAQYDYSKLKKGGKEGIYSTVHALPGIYSWRVLVL